MGKTKLVRDHRFELLGDNHNSKSGNKNRNNLILDGDSDGETPSSSSLVERADFTLRLSFAERTDAGQYECQVSTDPKISKVFSLNVVGEKPDKFTLCNEVRYNLLLISQYA